MTTDSTAYLNDLQLFLENVCCDLCRFKHSADSGLSHERVCIRQEVYLGMPGAFSDIHVRPPGARPYFLEVKYTYSVDRIVRSLLRKYAHENPQIAEAERVIVLVESLDNADRVREGVAGKLQPALKLEFWDEAQLLRLIEMYFHLRLDSIRGETHSNIRAAVDRAKGKIAFADEFKGDPLEASLIWHFSFWQLQRVREARHLGVREILVPGNYRNVAVIFADLSSFSSFLRDTRDDEVVRYILTSFYSKARYQVINSGGMLYQFLGDGVLALFGLLEQDWDYVSETFLCAKALLDIGSSIMGEWQRQIDHVQQDVGAHIGIAFGDLQMMSLRPLSLTNMGAIGDAINTAARLSSTAKDDEIVTSNTFFQRLPECAQSAFSAMDPVAAHNIGRIGAWRFSRKELLSHSAG